MTKSELISSIAKNMNCTKKYANTLIDAIFATIQETLANNEKISISGFGTFEVRERGEKTCINPKTKVQMVCPPRKSPVFKAGRNLKREIKK